MSALAINRASDDGREIYAVADVVEKPHVYWSCDAGASGSRGGQ